MNVARKLATYLAADPAMAKTYERIRREVSPVRPSQYDVATMCNLQCEGCLFFAGKDNSDRRLERDEIKIDSFFAAEVARGVNFFQFGGAEPALNQSTLQIAARHCQRGVVFTNGTVKISADVPFALHISVWGLRDTAKRLRGADTVSKALRNYADDPRALFVFTISAQNLDHIPAVAEYFANAGARLSFNHFSDTVSYADWRGGAEANRDYFRVGYEGEQMAHTPQTLAKAQILIADAMARYPDAIIYSHAFNRWLHQPDPLYSLGPDGVAIDCGSRVTSQYRHFHTDLTDAGPVKCCAPNLDCRTCRLYVQSLATALSRLDRFAEDEVGIGAWIEMWDFWCRLHIPGWPGSSDVRGRTSLPRAA